MKEQVLRAYEVRGNPLSIEDGIIGGFIGQIKLLLQAIHKMESSFNKGVIFQK